MVDNIILLKLSYLCLISSKNSYFSPISCSQILATSRLILHSHFDICFDEFSLAYYKEIVENSQLSVRNKRI